MTRFFVPSGLDLLTLMSVSGRFRMVALDAEFWIAEELEFDSLPSNTDYTRSEAGRIWLAKMNSVRYLLPQFSRRIKYAPWFGVLFTHNNPKQGGRFLLG